jgi:multiple sugar transport system permease protein
MNSNAHFTAPVGIRAFFTGNGMTEDTWAELMAASVLVTLPSVTLFALLQRYVRAGFLSGAVKG